MSLRSFSAFLLGSDLTRVHSARRNVTGINFFLGQGRRVGKARYVSGREIKIVDCVLKQTLFNNDYSINLFLRNARVIRKVNYFSRTFLNYLLFFNRSKIERVMNLMKNYSR